MSTMRGLGLTEETMEILGAKEGTTYPCLRSRGGGSLRPTSNPIYEYMCTWIHYRRSCIYSSSNLRLRCLAYRLYYFMFLNICSKGCSYLTLYINQVRVYKSNSRIRIGVFFLVIQVGIPCRSGLSSPCASPSS